jgi:phosphoserine aminotransferase
MRPFNFSAGPSPLPEEVLKTAQDELLNYQASGSSVMELSHRSKQFEQIIFTAQDTIRSLLNVPANYKILFVQGGGYTQFAAVPFNLVTDMTQPVDYIVTGNWSQKAYQEALKMGLAVNCMMSPQFDGELPILSFSKNPAFIYYCDNETVHGIELDIIDKLPQNIPIVCDASSSLFSKRINVSRYGVIFGGAQKNFGPAGVTLVIVRDDLLDLVDSSAFVVPTTLSYKIAANSNSLYNTPPTFAIYVTGLYLKWLADKTLDRMEQINKEKAQLLYSTLDKYPGIFYCPVKTNRSRMNVCFRILANNEPSADLESKFILEAVEYNLTNMKGYRTVGGIRVSLYNAVPLEAVQSLVKYIDLFCSKL